FNTIEDMCDKIQYTPTLNLQTSADTVYSDTEPANIGRFNTIEDMCDKIQYTPTLNLQTSAGSTLLRICDKIQYTPTLNLQTSADTVYSDTEPANIGRFNTIEDMCDKIQYTPTLNLQTSADTVYSDTEPANIGRFNTIEDMCDKIQYTPTLNLQTSADTVYSDTEPANIGRFNTIEDMCDKIQYTPTLNLRLSPNLYLAQACFNFVTNRIALLVLESSLFFKSIKDKVKYMYESRDSVGKSCIFLQYEVLSDAARRGCGRVLTPTVPMDYGPPLGLGMQPVRATCIYLQPSNMSGYQMIYPGAGSLLADSRVARVDRPSSAQLASRLGMTLLSQALQT
ncbi:hypothetical protein J6590_096533, partial [Homalodisca vitripennis]